MSERVWITEVGPRDGLQNQPKILTPAERVQLVRSLDRTGVPCIEVGSFVSPKAVPAMANTDQVVAELGNDERYCALIPNLKGYELARAAGVRWVTMVLYASETFSHRNVGMSKVAAEEATAEIIRRAKEDGVGVIATASACFECPYDGATDPAVVEGIAARFLDQGVDVFVVADTIGAANPGQVKSLMQSLVSQHGAERLGCHFHDTRAMGVANVYSALEVGIRRFDACIAGLGGCPFAPGATGNVATEDVVMMLQQMGFDTGIDLAALMSASALAEQLTGTAPGGRARAWLEKNYRESA